MSLLYGGWKNISREAGKNMLLKQAALLIEDISIEWHAISLNNGKLLIKEQEIQS